MGAYDTVIFSKVDRRDRRRRFGRAAAARGLSGRAGSQTARERGCARFRAQATEQSRRDLGRDDPVQIR